MFSPNNQLTIDGLEGWFAIYPQDGFHPKSEPPGSKPLIRGHLKQFKHSALFDIELVTRKPLLNPTNLKPKEPESWAGHRSYHALVSQALNARLPVGKKKRCRALQNGCPSIPHQPNRSNGYLCPQKNAQNDVTWLWINTMCQNSTLVNGTKGQSLRLAPALSFFLHLLKPPGDQKTWNKTSSRDRFLLEPTGENHILKLTP